MLAEATVLCCGFMPYGVCIMLAYLPRKYLGIFAATCNYIRLWTNSQGSMIAIMCKVHVRAFSNIVSVIVIH